MKTLYRFHKPSLVVRQGNGLVSAGDRLFFTGLHGKGNIWLTQLPK